ncbi:MAG: TFIIB-type zinc finger domain-containing protein [Promethearchaeia archaeon]
MINNFFRIFTYTPWEVKKEKKLEEVKLLSIRAIFPSFPIIESEFFEDLLSNIYEYSHYSYYESIRRIIGPNKEDYNITPWLFLWAMDKDGRIFQMLFQKTKLDKKPSQAVLVALAPPELVKLFSQFKKNAIHKTLSLLNSPKSLRFLIVLGPKGKSLVEESKFFQIDRRRLEKLKYIAQLANMPNVEGQWFPSFVPRCPICNELLVGIEDYRVGFGQLICPRCGYTKSK